MAASTYLTFGCEPGQKGNSVYLVTDDEEMVRSAATTGRLDKYQDKSPVESNEHYKGLDKPGNPDMHGDTGLHHRQVASAPNIMEHNEMSGAFPSSTQVTYGQMLVDRQQPTLMDQIIEEEDEEDKGYIQSIYAHPGLNNSFDFAGGNLEKEKNSMNINLQMVEKEDAASLDKQNMADLNLETAHEDASKIVPHPKARKAVESYYISVPNMHNYVNHQQHIIRQPVVEKYVIETAKTGNEQTDLGITAAFHENMKPNVEAQQQGQVDYMFDNASDTATARNFTNKPLDSDYAFNVDEYGNVDETLVVPSENQEFGMKPEIGGNNGEEEAADERDSNPVEDDAVPIPQEPVTEKTYLESYYNANDMRHWNIY